MLSTYPWRSGVTLQGERDWELDSSVPGVGETTLLAGPFRARRSITALHVVRSFYTKVRTQIQGARCQGKAIRRVRSLPEPVNVRFDAERRHTPAMFADSCAAAKRPSPASPKGWGSGLPGSLAFGCRVRQNLGGRRRGDPGRSLLSRSLLLSQPCSGCRPRGMGTRGS